MKAAVKPAERLEAARRARALEALGVRRFALTSVREWRGAVEKGALVLSVGGSQPGRGATLAATVAVASTTLLADC